MHHYKTKTGNLPTDILIEIARNPCGTLEFDNADEMIELGHIKTQACLGLSIKAL